MWIKIISLRIKSRSVFQTDTREPPIWQTTSTIQYVPILLHDYFSALFQNHTVPSFLHLLSIPPLIRIPLNFLFHRLLNTLLSLFPRRKQPVSLHLYSTTRICKTDHEHPARTPADFYFSHIPV